MRTRWDTAPYKGASVQVLFKGAALHRSGAAFDWLLSLVADGEHRIGERVLRDLTAYRGNERLRQRLAAALAARQDADLIALLARVWPAGPE